MMERKGAAKIAEKKLEEIKQLAILIEKYPTIALLDMNNLPARQLYDIKSKLKDKISIRMSKKDRIIRALKDSKKEKLIEYIKGMPAFLFSELDSFEIAKLLKENQSPAAAKVGQIAPNDIKIQKGLTPLAPGPIISALGAAGVKAGIDKGKIAIKEDTIIVKKGEELSKAAVDVLNALKIEPMTIGVTLVASLEKGEVLPLEVLDIDVEEYISKLALAQDRAFKLAVGAGVLTPETASFLILDAAQKARVLAKEAGILTKETASQLIKKAKGEAQALGQAIKR